MERWDLGPIRLSHAACQLTLRGPDDGNQAGARIGADAIVGAATVVDGEVPAGAIVAGNPARIVGSVR